MHPAAYVIASISILSLLIIQATTTTTTTPPVPPATGAAAMTTKTIIPVVDISDPAAPHNQNNITKTFQAGPYTYTLITIALYPDDSDPACSTDLPLALLTEHSSTVFNQLKTRCDIAPSPTSTPRNTSSSGSTTITDMRALRYGSWRCGQDRLYVDVLDEVDGSQRCLRSWMECLREKDGVVSGGVVVRLPLIIAMVGLVGLICSLLAV